MGASGCQPHAHQWSGTSPYTPHRLCAYLALSKALGYKGSGDINLVSNGADNLQKTTDKEMIKPPCTMASAAEARGGHD